MYALRQLILENFRFLFGVGFVVGLYKITETCACTAEMYGINVPFFG